jgi:hypothetical protein
MIDMRLIVAAEALLCLGSTPALTFDLGHILNGQVRIIDVEVNELDARKNLPLWALM